MRLPVNIVHFLRRVRVLRHLSLTTEVRYEKTPFAIPLLKSVGYAHCVTQEHWLPHILSALQSKLGEGRCFIDVGVNIGQTLLTLKSLMPEARYVGFEPNKVCVNYVQQLVAANHLTHVEVYDFGLSDANGSVTLDFYYSDTDDSSASVVEGFRSQPVKRRIPVSLRVGDELELWNRLRAGIIKIDVEGSELEVIKGLTRILSRDRPCIICEVLPAYSPANVARVERQQALKHLLKEMEYSIYQINVTDGVVGVDDFRVDVDIANCNYVFVPRENPPEAFENAATRI